MDDFENLESFQEAFEAEKYDEICESFCHEGYGEIGGNLSFDIPLEDRWVEVGICSHGEKIFTKDLPKEYYSDYDPEPLRLSSVPFKDWPDVAKLALRKVCEHILQQFKNGREGC